MLLGIAVLPIFIIEPTTENFCNEETSGLLETAHWTVSLLPGLNTLKKAMPTKAAIKVVLR